LLLSIREGSCGIDDSKKRVIIAFLCGQMAAESQYHFSVSDCLANSVRKRFEDSAVQILGYRICGEREFSDRLKEANLKALKVHGDSFSLHFREAKLRENNG
jgi:hypothetical protein